MKRNIKVEERTILLQTVNPLETDEISGLKNELIPFLKKHFDASQIEINAHELSEEEDKSDRSKLYTAHDKLNYLMDKKPIIKQLKDELGLDPDF